MTPKSGVFRALATQMLSDDREERDQACLDFRVLWVEFGFEEQVALSVLLAHVLADETDPETREEELYALATVFATHDLPSSVRSIVRNRGTEGLNKSELVSWHTIADADS